MTHTAARYITRNVNHEIVNQIAAWIKFMTASTNLETNRVWFDSCGGVVNIERRVVTNHKNYDDDVKDKEKCFIFAVNKMETHVVTGGRNSLLIVWRDVTEERKQKAIQEQEEQLLQEQKLANLLQSQQLTAALSLALKLNKPFQVLKIVNGKKKRNLAPCLFVYKR